MPPLLRSDARSERLENKARPGWNCWRSPHSANVQAATDEDRRALAALVDQLDEASDTTALTRARALLADA